MNRRVQTAVLQLTVLLGGLVGAVMTSRAGDWRPAELVVLLAFVAVASDAFAIRDTKDNTSLSGSFIAIVLAACFLGPAPAVLISVLTIVASLRSSQPLASVLDNLATYATFPLLGGLLARALVGHAAGDATISFTLGVLAVYVVTMALNFLFIAGWQRLRRGTSIRSQIRTAFIPLLPMEVAAATLVLFFGITYGASGLGAVTVLLVASFAFQILTRALLLSQHRSEELTVRTTELASLQVGVLAALVQTLSLRDKMTARHSAAVARYAKAIAGAIGCSKEEQELVHTAGLLHDIGKFIFPDSILFADRRLSDDDWQIVKKHPGQGARVVGRVSGYGPVAEIIHAHHERIDGTGYPRGLAEEEIPVLSRMISIADTYDVMTARDSYRDPVSQAEAIAELRRVSGKQLDGTLVEVFISILETRDVRFQHTTDADFERELNFETRVAGFLSAPAA